MTERERRILNYYGSTLHTVYNDEATLLKKAIEFLEMFDSCKIVRQNAGARGGVADIILCYKGKFVACELKDATGKPTPQQLEFIASVIKSGGIAGVCRTLHDIWKLLERTTTNT